MNFIRADLHLTPRLCALGLVVVAFTAAGQAGAQVQPTLTSSGETVWRDSLPISEFSPGDQKLLDELERGAFRYFVEQSNLRTGLVADRAHADGTPVQDGVASIATSGFALSAWTIAVERGWVDRASAVAHIRFALQFLADKAPRQHGFYYHWMEMGTGKRAWRSEISSIDTSLFLAGALVAREYFRDPQITELVNRIYAGVEWDWFLDGGDTVSLGWYDETGFERNRWREYSEHMIITLLGLGAPAHALSARNWQAWERGPVGRYAGYQYLQGAPALFVHQYAQAYFDFSQRRDARVDYFQNSVLATQAQRQFCIDLSNEFPKWGPQLWGVSASDSVNGYKAWGGPPRPWGDQALDGTVVPSAAAGSIPFAPEETMETLRHMRTAYGSQLWGRYGFADAFNPATHWINPDVIGIDQGISMIQAENARTGLIWRCFMQAPEMQLAARKAGFVSTRRHLGEEKNLQLRQLAGSVWKTLSTMLVEGNTAGLQLTAVLAAMALGLIDTQEAITRSRAAITAAPAQPKEAAAAYAAALVCLRQALPAMAAEADQKMAAIDWGKNHPASDTLGSADRLAVFFQVATGACSGDRWTALARTPEKRDSVYTLAPGNPADQLLPGLWLDERSIISGASAAQLAYATAMARRADSSGGAPALDPLTAALLLEYLPAEIVGEQSATPLDGLTGGSPADQAALLISLANLLDDGVVRRWFQQDKLVQAGRAAIPEFAEAAFGPNNSIIAWKELAGSVKILPARIARAVSQTQPRSRWEWLTAATPEYLEHPEDSRPGDPPLELAFAFTWDSAALHFHARLRSPPPGGKKARDRAEVIELFIDPMQAGLAWHGPRNFQFAYTADGQSVEHFHGATTRSRVTRTAAGFELEATIPWSALGCKPAPGLMLGVSAAAQVDGHSAADPAQKLNWCYRARPDGRFDLGTLNLE